MALLKIGRSIPQLQRLAGALSSGRIADQPGRLAQYNPIWWSSTTTNDNKEQPKTKAEEQAASAAAGNNEPETLDQANANLNADKGGPKSSSGPEGASLLTPEELMVQLNEAQVKGKQLSEQVESLTDKLKRSLAEMENVRMRSAREVETAKKFGPQSVIKDLLDVPDNLERAAASVPEDALQASSSGKAEDAEKLRGLLKGLLEGVRATEKILLQVLRKQGVEQYNPLGEKFDPNLHNALFEVPDGTKEVGTVAMVTKRGYKMHDRIVRPAEVGVARAP